MEGRLAFDGVPVEQDRRLSDVIAREQTRLRQFIRARVRSDSDAEDIFQEVFYELVDAYRLTKPLEQVGAWLFRVARNRITDLFRRRRSTPVGADAIRLMAEEERSSWEDLLPSREAGPDALYAKYLRRESDYILAGIGLARAEQVIVRWISPLWWGG
jgi:RNA polymerase sigma factor (sigma-70 family)